MTPYHLGNFEVWLQSWGAASTTVEARLIIARVIATRFPDPHTVTAGDLAGFLARPTFSQWTRTTYYGHMRSLFGWLYETGVIAVDPTERVRRPTPPGNKPRPLTEEQLARALASARGDLHTWLLLGALAGLRAHETAKLEGRDVSEHSIFVRGKGGKDAILPTHPLLWELAQHYPRDGYWVTGRYGHARGQAHVAGTTVSRHTSTLFAELGITGSYQRCRHTFGTRLLRAGANVRIVQTLMRHESLATTAAYLAVEEREQQAAIRLLAA